MSLERSIGTGVASGQHKSGALKGRQAAVRPGPMQRGGGRRWLGAALARGRGIAATLGLSLLAAAPAGALTSIDFDSLPSLSDVATAPLAGVSLSSALVVSEADAAVLTGFNTSAWANSGVNGLLNVYGGGALTIDFAQAITTFGIRLLALPSDLIVPATVTLSFFEGTSLLSSIDLTAGGADLPGGFRVVAYDASLPSGTITRAVISPDSGDPTTFFVDDLTFTPVPEPGTALLISLGLGALVATRRAD
jgi:hypothetical protein